MSCVDNVCIPAVVIPMLEIIGGNVSIINCAVACHVCEAFVSSLQQLVSAHLLRLLCWPSRKQPVCLPEQKGIPDWKEQYLGPVTDDICVCFLQSSAVLCR